MYVRMHVVCMHEEGGERDKREGGLVCVCMYVCMLCMYVCYVCMHVCMESESREGGSVCACMNECMYVCMGNY